MKKLRDKLNSIVAVSEQRKLSVNFANFGLFQIISYIVPLVTIPFIVRIIGPEKFGIISIAQALIYYLWIIADFGYSLSGIQLISQNQDNNFECSKIVKNIFVIQFALYIFCITILLLLLNYYKPFSEYKFIFLFYSVSLPANILLAAWFYTGMEKVKYVSTLTFISRFIYVILIFSLLRTEDDYILIPVFYSISLLAGGILSFVLILSKFGIDLGNRIHLNLFVFLKRDRDIFISNILMNFYRNSNVIILSFFASEGVVGIYSAGEKIIKAVQGTFAPITQSFYPYIARLSLVSKGKSKKVVKYLMIAIGIMAGLVSIMILFGSEFINHLAFGDKFQNTAVILKIGSPVIMLGALNFIVGIIFMTNYEMKKEFLKSVMIVGLFNLFSCSVLSYFFQEIGAVISLTMAELLLLIIMFLFVFSYPEKWKTVYGE